MSAGGHAMLVNPSEIRAAPLAKSKESFRRDDTPFRRQIFEHILRRIVDPLLFLIAGATPGIIGSAAIGGRAAAAEAIDREHVGTDLARLNRSYDPGAPKSHNNHIDFLIPSHLSRVIDDNRVKRR